MRKAIDSAKEAGDTLGGAFEVVAHRVPVGLGSHTQWDRRIDGRAVHDMRGLDTSPIQFALINAIKEIDARLKKGGL